MTPGQVPHHTGPWRDAHSLYLLSPLMGFLSWAWSLLRGPGPQQSWLLEDRIGADEIEAGVEGDSRAPEEEDGEAATGPSLDLKASSSAPEAWGPSCGEDVEYIEEEADRQPPRELTHGQPAPLSPSLLLSALQGPDKSPEEEQAEGREAAEEERESKSSYLSSHCQGGPCREEEDREAVNKEAGATSASSLAPGLKPSTWLCCPGEEERRATEDKETENKEAGETPISPWRLGSCPLAWQSCSGGAAEKDSQAREAAEKGEADPEPWPSVPTQGLLLGTCEDQPRENTEEEEEEEDEDWDSRWAEEERESEDSPTPTTNAFLRAWVYRPGEDTEEEEEEEDGDRNSGSAEEGEAEASSSTSPFLRAWVYRPGEDTEGEDEWEENQDTGDSGAAEEDGEADWGPRSSLQLRGGPGRARTAPPGGGTREEHAAEAWAGAEPRPLAVAIYVPGQKPPAPWAAPKLPLRLQRRLRLSETLTQDRDPETPQKDRKVRFSEKVIVHLLAVWAGPAQAARRGPWEQLARDRSRFARRIARAQEELGPCLTPAARAQAWARLGNSPGSLVPTPAPPQTPPPSPGPVPAPPLIQALASSCPSAPAQAPPPCLELSGRRG